MLAVFCLQSASAQGLANIKQVIPLGITTGIKVQTDGVMVIGLSAVMTKKGEANPSKTAGIIEGDVIKSIDNKKIQSNEMLKSIVDGCRGRTLSVVLSRNLRDITVSVKPEKNTDGEYKLGVWIRDGVTGIGTLTFYEPKNNIFGALGHGICDADTNTLVPLGEGALMQSRIVDIKKGVPGTPGELIGDYNLSEDYAILRKNSAYGIFGSLMNGQRFLSLKQIPIAGRNEIKTGRATIISNVEADTVSEFEIEILRIYTEDTTEAKNMLIQITDPRLIDKTGGIVQGMSGSPIVQDGKLVGAVTHVLVNEPRRGYGIFIENMLRAAFEDI